MFCYYYHYWCAAIVIHIHYHLTPYAVEGIQWSSQPKFILLEASIRKSHKKLKVLFLEWLVIPAIHFFIKKRIRMMKKMILSDTSHDVCNCKKCISTDFVRRFCPKNESVITYFLYFFLRRWEIILSLNLFLSTHVKDNFMGKLYERIASTKKSWWRIKPYSFFLLRTFEILTLKCR